MKVTRAATSYWYARPGGKDFYKPITPSDVKLVEVPYFGTPGVMEGEDLLIVAINGGSGPLYDDERFSGNCHHEHCKEHYQDDWPDPGDSS